MCAVCASICSVSYVYYMSSVIIQSYPQFISMTHFDVFCQVVGVGIWVKTDKNGDKSPLAWGSNCKNVFTIE